MALIDMIGFDISTVVADYFTSQVISSGVAINATAGKLGTNGLNYANVDTGGANHNRRDFPGGQTPSTVYCAWHMYRGVTMGSGNGCFVLFDGSSPQISLMVASTGQIRIKRGGGSSGTEIANSGAWTMDPSIGMWFEMKVVISDTVGEIVLKVNGVERINQGSLDTKATSVAQVTGWGQGEFSNGNTVGLDDVHIADTTGSVDNSWLGERRVIVMRPNASGDNAGGTSSAGGSSVFGNVDETTPNSDTDYNLMATSGLTDNFNLSASGLTTSTVYAVRAAAFARKTDTATCDLAVHAKSGSTTMEGPARALTTSYRWVYGDMEPVNDATGVAFTVAELDSLKAGYRRAA